MMKRAFGAFILTAVVFSFSHGMAAQKAAQRQVMVSTGTGFFVSADGNIITNHHVVDGCSVVQIARKGFSNQRGRVISNDETNDLALIATGIKPDAVAAFRSDIRLGETVSAFGFPMSGFLASSGNFTRGNVTALAGLGDDTRMYQISAPIQPGNSGGALLDQYGNVVGVIASTASLGYFVNRTHQVPQNINFAIKASTVLNFLQVNRNQSVTRTSNSILEPADIAEKAGSFSVQIICRPGEAEEMARAEIEARVKVEVEARLRAEADLRRKAEAAAKVKIEEEARVKAEAESKARIQAEERVKAEAASKREAALRAESEAKAKIAAGAKAVSPPLKEEPVQTGAPTQVATLAPASPITGVRISLEIKKELIRVGCYSEEANEKNDDDSVRASLRRFTRYANLDQTPELNQDVLNALRKKSGRVCPLQCKDGRVAKSGQCVDDDQDTASRRSKGKSTVRSAGIASGCESMHNRIGCTCALQSGGYIAGRRWHKPRQSAHAIDLFAGCMRAHGMQ